MRTVAGGGLFAVLFLCVWTAAQAQQQQQQQRAPKGPKVDFFDYSGEDAVVSCTDHQPKKLQTGETVSIPYTHSSQACSVMLNNGKYVSFVISQVLPGSTNSGLSVSVDIDETYLFFTLDDTNDHEFVNYVTGSSHHQAEEENPEKLIPTTTILNQ
ncbi:unnamed protein product [Sphagnum jensenii]|jgi:hypothetical protein|uniref:Uncharacterized protein n=1 Tax=Sphagnum jensenii TaxID=128206 RepID=A0ABP0WXY3_9BRYO